MSGKPQVSDVILSPANLTETGYLQLVGHEGDGVKSGKERKNQICGWLVAEFDPTKGRTVGEPFEVSEAEVSRWVAGDFEAPEIPVDSIA